MPAFSSLGQEFSKRMSWKRLTRKCGPLFLAQDSYENARLKRVTELCSVLRDYVIGAISSRATDQLDPALTQLFVERLPDVLGRCDDPIYDRPLAAEAYAFVHLVDRYRRFWDILEVLLRSGELPVRRTLDTIDVGTGPAPALYAINDFYEELRGFAETYCECGALRTTPPRLRSIESSRAMVHLVHVLSELTGRPGAVRTRCNSVRRLRSSSCARGGTRVLDQRFN